MTWYIRTYLAIIISINIICAGCSNTSQPDKQDSIKLSEVVGDKITIQICNKVISIPKKPLIMIRSFIASNPPGYESVQVSLVPVDEVYLDFDISDFNNKSYDVFSTGAVISIGCDDRNEDIFFSMADQKLVKVMDLPDLGLSQYKVEKPRINLEEKYFFTIDTVKLSNRFYIRCQRESYGSCYMTGMPIEGIGMKIEFSDLRDWQEYKTVFESLITIEDSNGDGVH